MFSNMRIFVHAKTQQIMRVKEKEGNDFEEVQGCGAGVEKTVSAQQKMVVALIQFIRAQAPFILLKSRDFHNYLFRRAVQNFPHSQSAIMDNLKIYDSRLPQRNTQTPLQFLDHKLKSLSGDHSTIGSVSDCQMQIQPSRLLPTFSFKFDSYSIGDYVEYNVFLVEKYKILGRNISKQYQFRTRYSLLEALDEKMGGMGLPGKKFFGNKNPSFVQKRQVELEAYLNKVACSGKMEFYRFVKQIKDSQFNLSLKQGFSIE